MLSSAGLLPSLDPVAATAGAGASVGTVLLVEDEEALAELLMNLLRRLKVRVLHAADGASALALFAQNRASVTLAFVDCNLPDMGGGELCQELRQSAPGLPLLLTSGRDQRVLESEFVAGGPCSFLPKPYMPAEVMRRVSAMMPVAAG